MLLRRIIGVFGSFLFTLKHNRLPALPKKIAIIRSGGIGDVLMGTPLIAAIRKKWPKAHITYVVGEWAAPAIQNNKNIDAIITFQDAIIFKKNLKGIFELITKIKKEKFELGFVLDKAWEFGVLALLGGVRVRVGFDRYGEGFANNLNVKFHGSKYELEYYRDLAKVAGIKSPPKKMEFFPTKKEKSEARLLIKKYHLEKCIVLVPGGAKNPGHEFIEKRWPATSYAQVGDSLSKNKRKIVLIGAASDSEIIHSVAHAMKKTSIDLAGIASLGATYCIMKQARLIITHDSGPMHLAAASGAPLIAIFGPTPAKRFGPSNARIISATITPPYDAYGKTKNIPSIPIAKTKNIVQIAKKILGEKS